MTLETLLAALDEMKEYTNDPGKKKIDGIKLGIGVMMRRPVVLVKVATTIAALLSEKESLPDTEIHKS